MTTEKMTIHKALSELKILDTRIIKEIDDNGFCAANKHSSKKINGIDIEDFEKKTQGAYDKITDLIRRRKAIKKAVVLSNSKTIVSIGGIEYSVAEAIEMKNHGLSFERTLLDKINIDYQTAQEEINDQNEEALENRADQYVMAIFGQKENKTNATEVNKLRKEFIEANSYEMVDPINIPKRMEELNNYISEFMAEVDSALSVSNALTEITIEY